MKSTYRLSRAIEIFRDDGVREGLSRTARFVRSKLRSLAREGYIRLRYGDRVVQKVHGSEMVLDPTEPGIHRDLVLTGEREPLATERFRGVLIEVRDWPGSIYVFDLGANIGYYALLEANVLGDRADIYCFEPAPANVRYLEENIRRNGYDQVSVVAAAVGDEETTSALKMSPQSNLHQLEQVSNRETVGSIDVPVKTLDGFVDDLDIDAEDLVVVRMDIEGGEEKALAGMDDLFDSEQPMYVFLEIHKDKHLGKGGQRRIFDRLEDAGFELDYANRYYGGEDRIVHSFDELEPADASIHAMARRF